MAKQSFFDKIIDYYNNSVDLLTTTEKYKKKIIDYIIELKIADVAISDKRIISEIKNKFDKISAISILQDISIAERILAGGKNSKYDTDKYWIRYVISEVTKEAIRIARDKGDSYSMIMAASTLGKHHLTDKEDEVTAMYDKIIPFIPVITSDPTTIGLKAIPEKEKKRLFEYYLKNLNEEIEFTTYDEIEPAPKYKSTEILSE